MTRTYLSPGKKSYDCIVPVSGGRDSYFIVHTVTKVLGLKPLLVSYNKHFNTPEGIHNLNHLKTVFDCDHIQMNAILDRSRQSPGTPWNGSAAFIGIA